MNHCFLPFYASFSSSCETTLPISTFTHVVIARTTFQPHSALTVNAESLQKRSLMTTMQNATQPTVSMVGCQ